MQSSIPTLEKGAKNTAKKEWLSPSERHGKQKKHRPHQRGQPGLHNAIFNYCSFYGGRRECRSYDMSGQRVK